MKSSVKFNIYFIILMTRIYIFHKRINYAKIILYSFVKLL